MAAVHGGCTGLLWIPTTTTSHQLHCLQGKPRKHRNKQVYGQSGAALQAYHAAKAAARRAGSAAAAGAGGSTGAGQARRSLAGAVLQAAAPLLQEVAQRDDLQVS
jgi:hypothetical protein